MHRKRGAQTVIKDTHGKLTKTPAGNAGLDRILHGGPGCGKSLLALEFVVRGAETGEPGIYVPFEERATALRVNAATLGPGFGGDGA